MSADEYDSTICLKSRDIAQADADNDDGRQLNRDSQLN